MKFEELKNLFADSFTRRLSFRPVSRPLSRPKVDNSYHRLFYPIRALNSFTDVLRGLSIDEAWNDAISVTLVASRFWRAEDEADEKTTVDPTVPDESPTVPSGKKKKKKAETTQSQLILEGISKGIFKDVEPTIIAGEDMDIPTFIRRRVAVAK